MKYLLFLYSLSFSFAVNAKCLRDIFSLGIGGTSSEYKLSTSQSQSNINSDYGINLLGSWILFCPNKNLEITNQFELRKFDFKNSEYAFANNKEESISLLNISSTISYLYHNRLEILGKTALEQDLFFDQKDKTQKLNYSKDLNLSLLIGLKYNAIKISNSDIFLHLITGPKISFSDYSNGLGFSYEVGLSTIYKLKKLKSISLNLFYKNSSQDLESLEQKSRELTLNTAYVFRY